MAAEKIGAGCHVDIQVENKDGGTIQFTITADSRIRANNVTQHIQGEFCDVSMYIFITITLIPLQGRNTEREYAPRDIAKQYRH